jgi:hypothetical protein
MGQRKLELTETTTTGWRGQPVTGSHNHWQDLVHTGSISEQLPILCPDS